MTCLCHHRYFKPDLSFYNTVDGTNLLYRYPRYSDWALTLWFALGGSLPRPSWSRHPWPLHPWTYLILLKIKFGGKEKKTGRRFLLSLNCLYHIKIINIQRKCFKRYPLRTISRNAGFSLFLYYSFNTNKILGNVRKYWKHSITCSFHFRLGQTEVDTVRSLISINSPLLSMIIQS